MILKKAVLCLVAICLALYLGACDVGVGASPSSISGVETPSVSSVFDITAENYPRVDGSTATIPLGEALAALTLDMPREQCGDYAAFSGTTKSYEALMHNLADLLIVYEPADETLELKDKGRYKWEMAPIGKDALVFLVNDGNPVRSLSTEQLRGIYSGEITNWKAVGGEDTEIMAYQRNPTAGSQTMMLKLVMGNTPMTDAHAEFAIFTMEGLIQVIANFNNSRQAIGYSVYYYAHNMNPGDGVRFIAADGVEPTNETIRSGDYPYVNEFYAVIRKDEPRDSPARRLFDFLTSDAGQELVTREGYVSVREP